MTELLALYGFFVTLAYFRTRSSSELRYMLEEALKREAEENK